MQIILVMTLIGYIGSTTVNHINNKNDEKLKKQEFKECMEYAITDEECNEENAP